jgi:hypothetical protein
MKAYSLRRWSQDHMWQRVALYSNRSKIAEQYIQRVPAEDSNKGIRTVVAYTGVVVRRRNGELAQVNSTLQKINSVLQKGVTV